MAQQFWRSRGIAQVGQQFWRRPGGAAWSPSDLGANLVAWYDAKTGVYSDAGSTPAVNNDNVQQWNDQSGNGYHLSRVGSFPIYETAGLNSLPSVTITADGLGTTTNAVVVNSNIHCTIFVFQQSADGRMIGYVGAGETTDYGNAASAILAYMNSGQVETYAFNGVRGTNHSISTNTPYRYVVRFDGTNCTHYLNNSANASSAYNQVLGPSNGTIIINQDTAGVNTFAGKLSEIIITKSDVVSDLNAIDSYLVAKWGF